MSKFDINKVKQFFKQIKWNKKYTPLAIAGVAVIITGALILVNENPNGFLNIFKGLSDQKIAQQSIDYLNKSVLSSTVTATLVSVSQESGLVKIRANIGGTEYDLWATKDGKLLFPEAFLMNLGDNKEVSADTENTEVSAQTCDSLPKSDSPELSAFVVSQCPYGLQMQRILADIVQSAPALASNIKVRYMGSISNGTLSSMHGGEEADENLRQICIRDEQASKYWGYVACYLKAGDSSGCLTSTGVDKTKVSGCMQDIGRGIAYAQKDVDLTSQYSVKGSPTLILDGKEVSEFDFGGRTSESLKSIICCASNSQPGACSSALNTASAATSFSETYSGSGSNNSASCN
jgi:hypothetical protein